MIQCGEWPQRKSAWCSSHLIQRPALNGTNMSSTDTYYQMHTRQWPTWQITDIVWLSFLLLLLFGHSVMSSSSQLHGLQHARLPCLSWSPRVFSNLCPFSQWCHLTISSSVAFFSSYLQSVPASGSFPVSWLFPLGDYSFGSFSFSISLSNEYSWLISLRTDWFHLVVQGTLESLLQHCKIEEESILWHSAFFTVQLSHLYMLLEKP